VKRIEGVDGFRLIAVTAVIAIHTTPFAFSGWQESDVFSVPMLINQFSRFAVPFFFVMAGYFWGVKIRGAVGVVPTTVSMAKRIALVFIAWSFIYLLPYNVSSIFQYGLLGPIKQSYWNLSILVQTPLDILAQGTAVHLWFLVGLLTSLVITALFVVGEHVRSLMVCSVVLYAFGLFAKAYLDTPFGIHVDFNTRNGPFFGLIFFASGYVISRMTPNSGWLWKGLVLLTLGYVILFMELSFLHKHYGTSPLQDYVAGTYLVGLGCSLVALSNPSFLRIQSLSETGRLSLGIYAIHIIFVDWFHPIGLLACSPTWEIGYVVLVLLFSIAAVFLMSKSEVLRRLVI
jgi:surface polysaccharide O-acyltransferase-like enzyme